MKAFDIDLLDLINGAFSAWLEACGSDVTITDEENEVFNRMEEGEEMAIKVIYGKNGEKIRFFFEN